MSKLPTDEPPDNSFTSYNRYSDPGEGEEKQVSGFIRPQSDIEYVPVYELSVTDLARIAQKSEVYIRKIAREKHVGRFTPRGYLFDHEATTKVMGILEESAKRRAGARGKLLPYEQNVCWVLLKQIESIRYQFEKLQKERARDHLMFFEVFQTLMEWKESVERRLKELSK